MNLDFKNFFENESFDFTSIKSIVLEYLKIKLNIKDDGVILNLNLSDIDTSVISDLLNRGEFSNIEDSIKSDIKKQNMSIQELIELLSKNN